MKHTLRTATHRTPILASTQWTYWNERLRSYRVLWDDQGRTAELVADKPR